VTTAPAPIIRRHAPLISLSLSLIVGATLAVIFWTTGLIDGAYVADLQDRVAGTRTGPGIGLALGISLLVGASMVVLPCGFPAVFMVPTILERDPRTTTQLQSIAAFLIGGVAPLVVVGALLGLAGDGIWNLLETGDARKTFAAIAYTLVGAGALAYALTEFGWLQLQGVLVRLRSPQLPAQGKPTTRALILGATFGGGMGIACPMPTYYAIIGWIIVAGSPGYGALVLGAYGLGRMLIPTILGILIVVGASRRTVAQRLASAHSRVRWTSGVISATLGAFMIVLFGALLGTSLL
jgi:cytochrome c-type biogenesis protein